MAELNELYYFKLATSIFSIIQDEYERTREMFLEIGGRKSLLELEPITQNAAYLHNPYIGLLNYIQVEMLRRLRTLSDPDSSEANSLREAIILTVNGIAAGLKNTR